MAIQNKKTSEEHTEASDWSYYTHIWKTEAAYLTWLRSQIRLIWNTCPQKLEFLKEKKQRLPKNDKNGIPLTFKNKKVRLYNAYVCELCGKVCYQSDKVGNKSTYAVDHVGGNHSLTKFEQVPTFVDGILRVKKEDLRILCYDCNMTSAYQSKHNMTFEEAEATKYAIKLVKAGKDKEFFIERNLTVPKNQTLRKQDIAKIYLEEVKNES